ncbi:hypothetical protein DVH02_08400 [Streptomyces corynorhini]|uniref:Uncharacterized protein n=2 Tax=Streptomyces corynorhini TaxID=2282652 RepID=A0A370BGS0_9ACTN|nr:hypothetical protein DVH02_08400 [Streptomyces corynorhini]
MQDLLNVKLTPLSSAITDWTQAIEKLKHLVDDAKAMKQRANGAQWEGENATVTREFVSKTAKEFTDAHTEATSIRDLLKDAHTQLQSAQTELKAICDNPPKGIVIHPDGVLSHRVHPDRRAKGSTEESATPAEFEALRTKLEAVLKRAAEADKLCAWGLRSLVKDHPHDFGSTSYSSLKDAKQARDAERAVQDRKEGREAAQLFGRLDHLSDKEMERLLTLTKNGENSAAFSAELLKNLSVDGREGQEALLKLTTALDSHDASGGLPETHAQLRSSLSASLAAATQPGAPLGPVNGVTSDWATKLLDVARDGNGLPDRHPGSIKGGFETLSRLTGLIGAGDAKYDGAFLESAASTVRDYEEHSSDPYSYVKDNWKGTQADPMGGLMQAFSRSPEAAEAFFDPKKSDNLQYFLKDRDWPGSSVENDMPQETIETSARHYFGQALEAAATGHEANAGPQEIPARHSATQAAIFTDVVKQYGADIAGDPQGMPAGLRSGVGAMFADYAGDIHQILGKSVNTNTEFSHLEIGRNDLIPAMRAVAEDPTAFGRIHDALTTYIATGIDDHPAEDFVTKDSKSSNKLAAFANQSASTMGHLDELRADVIHKIGEDKASAAAWNKMMQYHMIGAPFTNIPLAGDSIQRLVDVGTAEYMNGLVEEIDKETRNNLARHFSSGEQQIQKMLETAFKDKFPEDQWYLMDTDTGQFESILQTGVENSYYNGLTGGAGNTGRRAN